MDAWHSPTVLAAVLAFFILGTRALDIQGIHVYLPEVHSMLKAHRQWANQEEVGPGWTRWWTGQHSSWSP